MFKKLLAPLLIFLVLGTAITVMIMPTLFSSTLSHKLFYKEIDLELILEKNREIAIVFFGYSACDDVCTPRMESLAKFYNSLDKKTKQKIEVEFLDISQPVDKTLPSRYAQYFNQDFKGIYLNEEILREYTKEFSVYFSQSLFDKQEYNHTENLYLVKKKKGKKVLRYMYNTNPYDFKQIRADIKELINE